MAVDRMGARPSFQITIDTEGDNLWAKPSTVTTKNAEHIHRFQALCERHGLRPTYLVNWEMANCPSFQDLGRDIVKRSAGEIGMHLHAWDSPPIFPQIDNSKQHAYLIEYPVRVMREKIKVMTSTLENVFGVKVTSHRAGRWAMNETYVRLLVEHGYQIDCSVTPNCSWKASKGASLGGTDYTSFPSHPFTIVVEDGSIIELPMTIVVQRLPLVSRLARKVLGKSTQRTIWLRPNGRNLRNMLALLDLGEREGRPYVQFMLHSSEFMPGGSPTFDTVDKVRTLFSDLEVLFTAVAERFTGATLSEYVALNRNAQLPSRTWASFDILTAPKPHFV